MFFTLRLDSGWSVIINTNKRKLKKKKNKKQKNKRRKSPCDDNLVNGRKSRVNSSPAFFLWFTFMSMRPSGFESINYTLISCRGYK